MSAINHQTKLLKILEERKYYFSFDYPSVTITHASHSDINYNSETNIPFEIQRPVNCEIFL